MDIDDDKNNTNPSDLYQRVNDRLLKHWINDWNNNTHNRHERKSLCKKRKSNRRETIMMKRRRSMLNNTSRNSPPKQVRSLISPDQIKEKQFEQILPSINNNSPSDTNNDPYGVKWLIKTKY